MPRIFSQINTVGGRFRKIKEGLVPVAIEIKPGSKNSVVFSTGARHNATCLHCNNAPCIEFGESEVISASIPEFPADRNSTVCPTGAITKIAGGAPAISADACMFCGVCAARCPVGAISMEPHAVVSDRSETAFPETTNPLEAASSVLLLQGASKRGEMLVESDELIDHMHVKLLESWRRIGDRFPDLCARNLLIGVGAGAAMRRKGDNNVRMDIVIGSSRKDYGCVEAEFGDVAILNAPRDIMDDVAVSVGRLRFDQRHIIALVVTDVLPNRRSEYWRIVSDVREVLDIKIGTLTVLALCMLIWSGKKISALPKDLFHVHDSTENYRAAVLEKIMGRRLKISEAPRPFVEVAK